MKSLFKSFMSFCEAFSTARTATYLARLGHYKEATALYNK